MAIGYGGSLELGERREDIGGTGISALLDAWAIVVG